MGNRSSSIYGAALAAKTETVPTRLVRASVVDIRTAISKSGIPRTQVDCVGVITREIINGAVLLGWSGMLWQQSRPPLRPTTRNISTGTAFSDNAVDRMAEMAYDVGNSAGWDGDEVCIAFHGRTAVVIGTFHHRMAWIDLEPNALSDLEPGRRLQDDPAWADPDHTTGRDIIYTAWDDSHPDALVSRWGRYVQTSWETRGVTGELRRPNGETGSEGYYYASTHAQWEFSGEFVRAQSRRIRLSSLAEDTSPGADTTPTERHVLLISDGSDTSYSFPSTDDKVDGILGIVAGGTQGFSVTTQSGGDSSSDELASSTRYPEIKEVVDRMNSQITELREQVEFIRDTLVSFLAAVATITVTVPGLAALQTSGIDPASILTTLTPKQPDPDQAVLSSARSSVHRVGR